MKKHLLFLFAALLPLVTNAHDFEADGIYYNITSNTDKQAEVTFKGDYYNSYWDEYSGSITIPATVTYDGVAYSVTSIGGYAFDDCSRLTAINIPEGVTSIGDVAFGYCSSLTTINIPEGVTSIGGYAFGYCSNLTAINIPESVTSIGKGAFVYCSSLTAITLPEGVTSIGYYAFQHCSSLTAINIPEGVTSIGSSTFYKCSSLTAVYISSIEAWCKILFDDYDSNPLSYAHNLYLNGELVTELVIPEGVTSIGFAAFYNCSSLTAINIPEGVTSIGYDVFYGCSSLTSITCHAVTPPTVGNSSTFYKVDKSIPVYVPEGSVEDYKTAKYWKDFTNITALTIPTEVTITINQYGSGTYCSEYALDFSNVEGLKAYAAAGYDTKTGVVTLLRVMTAKAGVGLFIKGEPGEYRVPVIENTSYNSLNMLVGTLTETAVNATSGDGLYANYKYTIKEGNSQPLFYQFTDGSTLGAGKAYLQIPMAWLPQTSEAKSISLRFEEGEGTTDMENSQFTIDNSQLIYDLYGRRVDNPVKGGIYIVNGKKVVVK